MTDKELIRDALLGNQDSFQVLYKRHHSRVKNACWKVLRTDDLDDIVQETFIQAFNNLHRYRGEAAFSTWLHRIAVNTALMKIRASKRDKEELHDPLIQEGEDGEEFTREIEDSSQLPDRNIDKDRVANAIDLLPKCYREPVRLRLVFGYTISETAKILGCSQGNIKSGTYKAVKKLRKEIFSKRKMKQMPQELCQACKDAGYTDIIAQYKATETTPAQCFYHKTGVTPPWFENKELSAPVEIEADSPSKKDRRCKEPGCYQNRHHWDRSGYCNKHKETHGIPLTKHKAKPIATLPAISQPVTKSVSESLLISLWNILPSENRIQAVNEGFSTLPYEVKVKLLEAAVTQKAIGVGA